MEKPSHGGGGQDFWRRLHIFRPRIFLDLCSRRAKFQRSWLMEWGIASLWEDHEVARAEVEARIGEWLSTVPLPEDHEGASPDYNRHVNRDRRCQRRRLGELERLEPGVWETRIGVPAADWPERATRTAARIIGFLPRLPFVPAIVRWAENQAAAGHVSSERDVAALVRHNDLDHAETLGAVRGESERLAGLGTQFGLAAAAHLLRTTGEPDDADRAKALVPKTSRILPGWIVRAGGGEADVLSLYRVAVQDRSRDASLIAALADHASDPAVILDPTLAAALADTVERQTPANLPDLFELGGRKLTVLLRWHPESVFSMYRAYLAEDGGSQDAPVGPSIEDPSAPAPATGVPDADAIQHAHATFRRYALGALPFLSREEAEQLADTVEARAAPDGAGRAAANALRLGRMPAADQIRLLLETPADDWPTDFKYLLNTPLGSEVQNLILNIDLRRPRDEIWRELLLARQLTRRFQMAPACVARDWSHGLGHPDADVREHVVEIAHNVDGRNAARQMLSVITNEIPARGHTLGFEQSALLLKLDDVELGPLLDRLDPEALSHAYLHRPALRAQILPPWRAWMHDKLLVARNSRSFGGDRAHYRDRDQAYAAFLDENRDEAVRLVRTAWEDKALRDNIIWEHGEGPAWPLITALAASEPDLVKEVWRGSVSTGGGMWDGMIEEHPADLPPGAEHDDVRAEMLDRALTDEKLFRAVRVLEREGHLDFLLSWIRTGLCGARALDHARGFTAAGFLDATAGATALWTEIDGAPLPAGWLGEVRRKARGWFARGQKARHWYALMSRAGDEEAAYRAFWLHGRISDERVPQYFRAEGLKVDPESWRAQWLDFFREATKSMRETATAELSKSYLGDKRVHDIVHGR